MKKFRVTFKNYSLAVTAFERVQEILKNFYWQEENCPEDWADFDGDIIITEQQSRGGDCAVIEVSEQWEQWLYTHLSSISEIKKLEVWFDESSKNFVMKNAGKYSQPEMHQLNSFVSF